MANKQQSEATRRIVLTGFMGSGKSTVGPLLAARMGWRFVDVDEDIEAEAGTTIAALFAREGEPAFRARERAAIAGLRAVSRWCSRSAAAQLRMPAREHC